MRSSPQPYSNQEIAASAGCHGDEAQFARDRVKELRKALKSKMAIWNERNLGYILGWQITKDDRPANAPYLGRRESPPRACQIEFGYDGLSWRSIKLQGPVITGGQIIEAAKLLHPNEWIIVRWTAGALVEVRRRGKIFLPDDTRERFIAFKVDRTYRFSLNGRDSIWGMDKIDCKVLKELACTQPPADVIWLEGSDGTTRRRVEGGLVDLDGPGIERFFSETPLDIKRSQPRNARQHTKRV